jgi:hypothetical protein
MSMRALVVLVHYFKPEANPRHTSVDESRRENRTRALETVIQGYRGLFGPASKLHFADRALDVSSPDVQLDIRVLTVPNCSLLSPEFQQRQGINQTFCEPGNPRMLGFFAYRLFAKLAQDYDWFIFSEDDLLVRDPLMFDKLAWFNATFGDKRVLSPNRLEWNPKAYSLKTYVDGDISAKTFGEMTRPLPDEDLLKARPLHSEVTFQRARNPHSGFFAITKTQLAHWMAQPHWLDHDVSFVSPLESAATLGLTKTFAVYKPLTPAAFLEVEHLDDRFSKMGWRPRAPDLSHSNA